MVEVKEREDRKLAPGAAFRAEGTRVENVASDGDPATNSSGESNGSDGVA